MHSLHWVRPSHVLLYSSCRHDKRPCHASCRGLYHYSHGSYTLGTMTPGTGWNFVVLLVLSPRQVTYIWCLNGESAGWQASDCVLEQMHRYPGQTIQGRLWLESVLVAIEACFDGYSRPICLTVSLGVLWLWSIWFTMITWRTCSLYFPSPWCDCCIPVTSWWAMMLLAPSTLGTCTELLLYACCHV